MSAENPNQIFRRVIPNGLMFFALLTLAACGGGTDQCNSAGVPKSLVGIRQSGQPPMVNLWDHQVPLTSAVEGLIYEKTNCKVSILPQENSSDPSKFEEVNYSIQIIY